MFLSVIRTALLVALVAAVPRMAAAAGLNVGDTAPPLAIAEWAKGSPVDLAKDKGKKIHVVEFWAVWCPPCKMSVPLLTDMQKKYGKDVTIIGVTEPDSGANSPSEIRRFVRDQGSKMDYTVAIDSGATTQSYMAAAGAVGIPHAFVISKDGKIAWQGSPLDPELDAVLGKLAAGTFDLSAAKVEQEVLRRVEELNLLSRLGQWTKVWDGLIEILKLDPSNERAMHALAEISSEELKNTEAFREWAKSHLKTHKAKPKAMQSLASTLCDIGNVASRCPDIALEAAKVAYETNQRDAGVVATYARALYQIGALERAIALQQDALALAATGDQKSEFQGALEFYRTCKKLQETVK